MKISFAHQSKLVLAVIISITLGGLYSPLKAQTALSTYSAYTGTDVKTPPPAPALGAANTVINDPTFGTPILRVTDPNTNGGESFIPTDAGSHRTWNANSTAIKLTGPHGDGYWLEFDPNNFKVGDGSATPKVHSVSFGATWEWSTVDPDIMYYLHGSQIAKYNKATGVSTDIAGPSTGDPLDYMAVVIGQDNWICAAAGSGNQDSYTKIFCVNPVSPSTSKFIDVYNKTINGAAQSDPNWPTSGAGQVIGIHGISGGTGANWLPVTFHQQSWGGNGDAVFDLATNTWSLVSNKDNYWSGHISMGNGSYANAAGSQNGLDSRGMVLRNPDNIMNSSQYTWVGQPTAPWNGWCDADHNSWLNSLSNANAPILSSRYGGNTGCAYAWTGEIIGMAVDGSNTVYRFAHNHNQANLCYYGQSFAQISNDGKWALFSSPWDGKLGADTSFGCSTRIDTFILALSPGSSSSSGTTSTGSGGSSNTGSGGSTSGTSGTGTTGTTPPASTSVTRIEQNGAGVTYTGNWFPNAGAVNSGGSAVLAQDAGASVTIAFNGTGVTWIGYQDQWSGIAQVYVDGTLKASVDTYAATNKAQSALYSVSGLSSGSHTMKITVSGQQDASAQGNWVWVDAFDVTAAGSTSTGTGSTGSNGSGTSTTSTGAASAPATSTYRIEQSNPAVKWTGSWYVNNGSFNSGGTAKLAVTAGSRATFTFTGSSVSWIAYRDQWSGIGNVYMDGTLVTTVDTYASPAQAKTVMYTVSGLTFGTHTVAIEATGTQNANSGGAWIWVDAFDYVGAAPASAASTTDSAVAAVSLAGGATITSSGAAQLSVGSADVNGTGGATPSGLAVVSYVENGVTASEAGVPASAPVLRGRIDSEISSSSVNTGFAVANPNDSPATISFFFTDANGNNSGAGSLTLPPHGQLAHFLNEAPFNGVSSSSTFTFSSNVPVSAIAIRGLINERSEYLMTTLPVANPDVPSPATAYFPHVPDGGGWTTQFVLVNPTDNPITGTLRFVNQSGQNGTSVPYQIAARSAWRYSTPDSGPTVNVGSAEAIPDEANIAPVGVAIFSFQQNGITVSTAGVPSIASGGAFRMYAETSADGTIRTGIAVVNTSEIPTTAQFDAVNLDGTPTGLTGTLSLPAFGQQALFFDQIPGFENLPKPFQGVVRMHSVDGVDLAAIGLRGRLNERSEFIMTTTAPTNESATVAPQIVFPHFANGGGFLTEFILYSGTSGEPAKGTLNAHDQSGGTVNPF